jgi:hypothetical protein
MGWDWRNTQVGYVTGSQYRMNAYSGMGAVGLMQMKDIQLKHESKDLFDPEDNVKVAIRYFAYLKRNMHLSICLKKKRSFCSVHTMRHTRIQKDGTSCSEGRIRILVEVLLSSSQLKNTRKIKTRYLTGLLSNSLSD